jgi:hypothetical protein
MSHNDFLADELNSVRHSILECKHDINELARLYFVYKNLSLNLSAQNFSHADDFNSPLEWTHYSILEELVTELSPSSLEAILAQDSELSAYINEWREMDGFIAKLKYKTEPPNLDCFNQLGN